jgi:hypothetical protein
MTTTITVEAHCADDVEVVFGIRYKDHCLIDIETEILQNGQKSQKYVYDERQVVVYERKKKK